MEFDKEVVILPDMFIGPLKEALRVNQHHANVKQESEEWISGFCAFDALMSNKISKCDFSYFLAIVAPDADAERFRTICDWGNWVFPYDDHRSPLSVFDDGELKTDPLRAKEVMTSLMDGMRNDGHAEDSSTSKIIQVHDYVWQRFKKVSSEGLQNRFINAMSRYCQGALIQVESMSHAGKPPSPEEYLQMRRLSAGVDPVFALVEYAHDLKLPDYIFQHPIIREIETLGIDFVLIVNDILSYRKEEASGVPHNLVAASRVAGMTAQQAFDHAGSLLRSRADRWGEVVTALPAEWKASNSGGTDADAGAEDVSDQIRRYVQAVADTARANLAWSFRSRRYLGGDGEEVRRTRRLEVMRKPGFLRRVGSTAAEDGGKTTTATTTANVVEEKAEVVVTKSPKQTRRVGWIVIPDLGLRSVLVGRWQELAVGAILFGVSRRAFGALQMLLRL